MAEGHRERLRSRFLNESIDTIPEYVVLEMMLQGVIARKDTCGIARSLLECFGSLSAVIDAPLNELMKVQGVGEAAAYQLKLLPKFYRKYSMSKWSGGMRFSDINMVGQYLVDRCIGFDKEAVFLLCMDAGRRFIECPQISEGSINAVELNIRKILETALKFNASRVVLAHTHPGGNPVPSVSDIDSTRRIAEVLEASGIVLDNHVIVAGSEFLPICKNGRIIF